MGRSIVRFLLSTFIIACMIGTAGSGAVAMSDVALEGAKSIYQLLDTKVYGNGGTDVLLVHADTETLAGWTRTWGRPGNEYPKALTTDPSGNAVVVGDYGIVMHDNFVPQPGFIIKFSPGGDLLWARDLNWSNKAILLEDVDCDLAGNVYVTGQAWYYLADPDPLDGLYPIQGLVFTAKLDAAGELVWARRWNSDERDWISGFAILSDGFEVVVASHLDNRSTGNTDLLMLWYNAGDGSLNASQTWEVQGANAYPCAMDYGDSGDVYVGGYVRAGTDTDALLLKYSNGRVLQFSQSWGGSGMDTIDSVFVVGREVFAVGTTEVGKRPPPEGETYQLPILDGLCVIYEKDVLRSAQNSHDILYNGDSRFDAVVARSRDEVWISGSGGLGQASDPLSSAVGSGWYIQGNAGTPIVLEDANCGANTFAIDNAAVTAPMSINEFLDYIDTQRIYLSEIHWSEPKHVPDAQVNADVVSGPAPLTVNFDASSSTVPNGSIAGFAWNFDAGNVVPFNTDTGPTSTIQHTFDAPGMYLVAVQVTSDDGSTMESYVSIKVN